MKTQTLHTIRNRQSAALVLTISLLLALALVACGPRSQPTPETPTSPTAEPATSEPAQPTPSDSPLPTPPQSPLSPPPTPPAHATPAASAAVAYLAAELGVSPDEVTVLSSEPVEWSDASLGCPEPGMMYAQVITPGYRFVLQAQGQEYEVHTDRTGQNVVLCQPGEGD
jgi:hypothetical protein